MSAQPTTEKFILTETEEMKADFAIVKQAIRHLMDKYGIKTVDEKQRSHTIVQWQINHTENDMSTLEITQYSS